jgi:hypothetical protein
MNPACSRPSSLRLRDSKHDTMLLGRPPQGSRGYASHENKEFVRLDAEEQKRPKSAVSSNRSSFFTADKISDARSAMTVLGEALKQLSQEHAT